MKSAHDSEFSKIGFIPSGLPQLDKLLGGGYPRRRMVQISGVGGLGKSTLAIQAVAEAQKHGMKCLYVDTDYKVHMPNMEAMGVNLKKLHFYQEPIGEVLLETVEEAIRKGSYDFVVIDPVSGIVPRDDIEKDFSSAVIGKKSMLMQRFVRHMKAVLTEKNVAMLFLNHERPDFMTHELKVDGGKALLEAIAIWVRLKSAGKKIMQGDNQLGKKVIASIYQKNQIAPTEGQSIELDIFFGKGFSVDADMLEECIEKGIITKEGNTYHFEGSKLGVGAMKAKDTIESSPELKLALQTKLEAFSAKV